MRVVFEGVVYNSNGVLGRFDMFSESCNVLFSVALRCNFARAAFPLAPPSSWKAVDARASRAPRTAEVRALLAQRGLRGPGAGRAHERVAGHEVQLGARVQPGPKRSEWVQRGNSTG